MPWVNQNQPTALERVVGGLCYMTFGLAGLLYMIVSGRRGQTQFFRFHFLQSIILGIIGLLLSWASSIFFTLLQGLTGVLTPVLGNVAPAAQFWITQAVIVVFNATYLLLIYGMIWAFLGKFAEIPFISNIVRQQMR